ncbi:MAG: hypothetical protein WA432_04990 [Candidatus Babeliaceae bacterium]
MIFRKYVLGAVFGMLFLSGCRKTVKVFPKLDRQKAYHGKEEDLDVWIKVFSAQDSKECFGIDLHKYGYGVAQLQVHNRGKNSYVLKPSYCNYPLVSGKHIAQLMHYETSTWVTYLTFPAIIFFWPAIPLGVIPAGLSMRSYNRKIDKSLIRKSLHKHEVLEILPYEHVQKFLFFTEYDWTLGDIGFLNRDTRELISFTFPLFEKDEK